MYAAEIAYHRKQYVRAWMFGVAADKFSQAAGAVSVTTLVAAFSAPTSNDITLVVGAVTALVIALNGSAKIWITYKEKKRSWAKEASPKHHKPPDSDVIEDEDDDAPSATPRPDNEHPKKARVRRRKPTHDRDAHNEAPP